MQPFNQRVVLALTPPSTGVVNVQLGRKLLSAAVSVVIIVISTVAAVAENRIGVLASYVGEWGAYGQAYRNGIEMADVGPDTTFIYEEDGFLPAKSVTAFRKLVQYDRISGVMVGDSVTAQAVSPLALKLKLPLFVWAISDRVFTSNPYARRLWTSAEKDLNFVSDEVRRKGHKRLALFTTTHTYSAQWAQTLESKFPGSQWTDFSSPPDSFATHLLKARSAGFDAIGVCLASGMNGYLARQMKDLRIGLSLFGCNFLEGSADIRKAKDAFDGVWFTAPKLTPAFIARYKQRFGYTDNVISAAIFHDAALLIAKTPNRPFAIEGLREASSGADRHLDFDYQVLTFKGSEIVAP